MGEGTGLVDAASMASAYQHGWMWLWRRISSLLARIVSRQRAGEAQLIRTESFPFSPSSQTRELDAVGTCKRVSRTSQPRSSLCVVSAPYSSTY